MPVVAAAADLQFALEEIAEDFTRETGFSVTLTLGSSGNFARQIRQGAPIEVYLSADEDFVFDLADDGFTEDEGILYAVGRLVMMVPVGGTLAADGSLETLRDGLAAGTVRRFAIANPEHAPYGARAREALQAADLWEDIQPVLVLGENVAQAARFATSGNAEGGIAAYSLALAPGVAAQAEVDLIPEDTHQPLRQRMVLINGAGETARAFYDHMQKASTRAVLERYGFTVPDGQTP